MGFGLRFGGGCGVGGCCGSGGVRWEDCVEGFEILDHYLLVSRSCSWTHDIVDYYFEVWICFEGFGGGFGLAEFHAGDFFEEVFEEFNSVIAEFGEAVKDIHLD